MAAVAEDEDGVVVPAAVELSAVDGGGTCSRGEGGGEGEEEQGKELNMKGGWTKFG